MSVIMTHAIRLFVLVAMVAAVFAATALAQDRIDMQGHQEYQQKLTPLAEQMQREITACGNDQGCMMQVMSRFQAAMTELELPAVGAAGQPGGAPPSGKDCGVWGSAFEDCRTLTLEIKYGYTAKYYEMPDGVWQLASDTLLNFTYTVKAVLGFNKDFTDIHLFQAHTPLKKDVTFQNGHHRSWLLSSGGVREDDENVTLGNVNVNDPTNLIASFSLETEGVPGRAALLFEPFHLRTGPRFDDASIAGQPVPTHDSDGLSINTADLRPLLEKGGTWSFSRSFNHKSDARGSGYTMNFSVKAVSDGGKEKEPVLVTGDPAPDPKTKKAILDVSPNTPLKATRDGKTRTYKPRTKNYTVTNVGELPLSYTIALNVPWLDTSATSGNLKPNQSETVTISLNAQADALDPRKVHRGVIQLTNMTGGQGSTTRQAVLSNREKWRLTLVQANDLIFGDNHLYGGVRATVRTVIDFEIEDGVYKSGSGQATFTDVKSITKPAGVYKCAADTKSIDKTAFALSGAVLGKTVKLNIPHNTYSVKFSCVGNMKTLREHYEMEWRALNKLRKGETITSAQAIAMKKDVDARIGNTKRTDTQTFKKPIMPTPLTSLTRPLVEDFSRYGTETSVDYNTIRLERLN